jgi:hypothetical protein
VRKSISRWCSSPPYCLFITLCIEGSHLWYMRWACRKAVGSSNRNQCM